MKNKTPRLYLDEVRDHGRRTGLQEKVISSF